MANYYNEHRFEVRDKCDTNPGVWVMFRHQAPNANLVSAIREDASVFPKDRYEARASSNGSRYDIEVRRLPDQGSIADLSREQIRLRVEEGIRASPLGHILTPVAVTELTSSVMSRLFE